MAADLVIIILFLVIVTKVLTHTHNLLCDQSVTLVSLRVPALERTKALYSLVGYCFSYLLFQEQCTSVNRR